MKAKAARIDMRDSYADRGFKPLWRPLSGSSNGKLELISAHSRANDSGRQDVELRSSEIKVSKQSYTYPKLTEDLLHHVNFVVDKGIATAQLPNEPSKVHGFLFNLADDLCQGGIRDELQKKQGG